MTHIINFLGYCVFVAMAILIFSLIRRDYEDAMVKCQTKYSFDTCFEQLNN